MTTRLIWTASPSAACFYAVEHLLAGRSAVAPGIAESLAAPAAELGKFLAAQGIAPAEFFTQLTPAACEIESNRQLAHTALIKTVGRSRAEPLVEQIAGLLAACEQPYFAAFPKLREELELRFRPLRELWETRGPGMLAAVGRKTDKRLIVEEARVAVVPPFLGGGGWAEPRSNTVVIEAVLANPMADLPETVRLGWLVSLLANDLPDFAELLNPGRSPATAAWGMLPVVLEAAAELEVIRPDDGRLLASAAAAWLPAALRSDPAEIDERTIAAVSGWWQAARGDASRTERTPWGVKLKALEKLLEENI